MSFYLRFTITTFFFFLLTNIIIAQNTSEIYEHKAISPHCQQVSDKLHTIFGLKLLDSKNNVLPKLSRFNTNPVSIKGENGDFYIELNFPSGKTISKEFNDVYKIRLTFFEGKLYSYKVVYSKYRPIDLLDFVEKIYVNLGLNEDVWKIESEQEALTNCKQFVINLKTETKISQNENIPNPSFEVFDTSLSMRRLIRVQEPLKKENFLMKQKLVKLYGFDVEPQKSESCNLSLEQFPLIRGFKLLQSEENILKNLSRVKDYIRTEQTEEGSKKVIARFYNNNDPYKANKRSNIPSEFDGIFEMRFFFYDNSLYRFQVLYSEYKPSSISDFVKQTSDNLNIPIKSWEFKKGFGDMTSVCKDFDIELSLSEFLGDLSVRRLPLLDLINKKIFNQLNEKYIKQLSQKWSQEREKKREELLLRLKRQRDIRKQEERRTKTFIP